MVCGFVFTWFLLVGDGMSGRVNRLTSDGMHSFIYSPHVSSSSSPRLVRLFANGIC